MSVSARPSTAPPVAPGPAPAPGLLARARALMGNNVAAIAVSQVVGSALRFGGNLILTRLLAPEAFGVMLVINSVSFILVMLTETGVSPFVIRAERGAERAYRDTLFTVGVLRGILLAAVVVVGAPLFAQATGKPEVALPLQVASVLLVIEGFRSVAPFVALRRHQAARNAWVDLGAQALSLPLTILLVVLMDSYWGLVLGAIAGSLLVTLSTYVCYEDSGQRFAFDTRIFGELWRFSRFIIASSIATMVVMQFDKMFVVASFSLGAAGIYAIASNLATIPTHFSNTYYSRVYMPLVSERLREGAPSPEVFYDPMAVIRPLIVFACAGAIVFGDTVVRFIFPAEYAQVGAFFVILVVRPLIGALYVPTSMLLLSNGMTRNRFFGDCMRGAWIVIAAPLGWHIFGVWGLLWAVALTDLVPTIFQYVLVHRMGVFRLERELPIVGALGAGLALGWLAERGAMIAFG